MKGDWDSGQIVPDNISFHLEVNQQKRRILVSNQEILWKVIVSIS